MTITLNALQKQRRDTASNWTSNNTVLLAGEWGIESDTKKFKIGDGSTAWQSLDYVPIPDANRSLPGNLVVEGNFTVNGTTTTIDTTTLTVEDKNIELGKVSTPTDTTADGGGISLLGTSTKTINWVDSTDSWTFSEHVDLASGKVFKINNSEILSATGLGSSVVSSSLTSVGTITTGTWNATAISGSKVTPDFGSQAITTTGGLSINGATVFNETGADVDFRIESDSVTHMFFIDSGNNRVGISDSSPSCTFEVGGTTSQTAIFQSNQSTSTVSILDSDGDGLNISGGTAFGHRIHTSTLESLELGVNNSTKLTINSSGDVGIGTTSPSTVVEIKSAIPTLTLTDSTNKSWTSSDTTLAQIDFKTSDVSGIGPHSVAFIQASNESTSATTPSVGLVFGTSISNNTPNEVMRINKNGFVGIGKQGTQYSGPETNLHIGAFSTDSVNSIRIDGTNGSSGGQIHRFVIENQGDSALVNFKTSAANATETTKMTINSITGNVGIGTSNPAAKLHVMDGDLLLSDNSTATDSGQAIYFQSTTSGWTTSSAHCAIHGLRGANSTGIIRFDTRKDSSTDERMRIDSSGRLLAGTSSHTNINTVGTGHTFDQISDFKWGLALHCTATNKVGLAIRYAAGGSDHDAILFVKDTTVKFRVNSSGDCANANNIFTQVSDETLKENIVDANSQWNDIKNIKIRNWNFKSSTGYDTHTQIGVVAQEIETVSPKLVKTNEDGIKEVIYSVLNVKAIKCLQEAIAKIEVLETKVAALEAA